MGFPAGNDNDPLVWDNGTPFPGALRRPPRAPSGSVEASESSSPRSAWPPSSTPRPPGCPTVTWYRGHMIWLRQRSAHMTTWRWSLVAGHKMDQTVSSLQVLKDFLVTKVITSPTITQRLTGSCK